jgi:hypothetical protein
MNFSITNNSWNEIKDNLTVNTIRQLFFDAILPSLKCLTDCKETTIKLPEIVTKQERHKIHCMTMNGFNPESYNNYDAKRVMLIILSKKYVEGLFVDHVFKRTIPSFENNVKTEKQLLLESILKFIENNLKDEFSDYLKSI